MADNISQIKPGTPTVMTQSGGATAAPNTNATTSTVNNSLNGVQTFNQGMQDKINTMYDSKLANNNAQLKTAFDQNMSNAQAAKQKIDPQFQQQYNALAATYERQRRNNNMQAAVSGINTGAASQMNLGQTSAYQANDAAMRRQENEALTAADKGMLDIKTNYQNSIAEAAANNDYQKAAAMLDEYSNAYNRQMDAANRQAEFGDFSGFLGIYSEAEVKNMEKSWALQNPLLAYNLGKLTKDEYFKMTGKYPPGTGGSGSSSGGSSSSSISYYNPYAGGYTPEYLEEPAVTTPKPNPNGYIPVSGLRQEEGKKANGR